MSHRLLRLRQTLAFVALIVSLPASASANVARNAGFVTSALTNSSTSVLYYADDNTNAVYMLDANHMLRPPIAEITQGINTPDGLAVEPDGTLFVAGFFEGITEYAPGSTSPMRTLVPATGAYGPVAVSADGTLAIGCSMMQDGDIGAILAIYDKGSPIATRTISFQLEGQRFVFITAVAVDSADDVYVSVNRYPRGAKQVLFFAPNATVGTVTGLPLNVGMAFDAAGNLFLGQTKSISVYAPGTTTPFRRIKNGLVSAVAPAVTPNGTIFVANTAQDFNGQITPGDIIEYLPGRSIPSKILAGPNDQDRRATAFNLGL